MTDKEIERLREDILDGKLKKWDVQVDEGTPEVDSSGYFGRFTIISVGGKKTLVFCDPRDAICVPMIDDWYDDVKHTEYGWSPDTRFESSPNRNPLLVERDGKWTMIGYYGPTVERNKRRLRKPYCDDWYDSIGTREHWKSMDKDGNYCPALSEDCVVVEKWYDAVKDGSPVRLTNKCQVIEDDSHKTMAEVKTWDKDRIVKDWIEKGRPCYSIRGFRYRGAKASPISKEKALELIQFHNFGMGFSSLDWSVEDGKVALVFESYSVLDME